MKLRRWWKTCRFAVHFDRLDIHVWWKQNLFVRETKVATDKWSHSHPHVAWLIRLTANVGMCQNRSQYWFIFSHCSTSFHWFNYHWEGAGIYNGTTTMPSNIPTAQNAHPKKCSPSETSLKPSLKRNDFLPRKACRNNYNFWRLRELECWVACQQFPPDNKKLSYDNHENRLKTPRINPSINILLHEWDHRSLCCFSSKQLSRKLITLRKDKRT